MVQISALDVDDDDALRAYWDVEQAAQRAERRHPFLRSLRQLEQQVRRPGAYYERTPPPVGASAAAWLSSGREGGPRGS
ncbi:MAG TPA: hypothetical protein VHW64_04250 [Nocardioides sp.]|jgi:hypothetical protein|uniref:hypothetical protein n=1 Tax=Nocardioides sp. TaxID=35761 RepID=UPI002E37F38B|nr:hypothetical protein [Nocardioides sp.]HEX3929888.1 hypothetical protein [Nocardioides sp.]